MKKKSELKQLEETIRASKTLKPFRKIVGGKRYIVFAHDQYEAELKLKLLTK